jgi:hypothetical protein
MQVPINDPILLLANEELRFDVFVKNNIMICVIFVGISSKLTFSMPYSISI